MDVFKVVSRFLRPAHCVRPHNKHLFPPASCINVVVWSVVSAAALWPLSEGPLLPVSASSLLSLFFSTSRATTTPPPPPPPLHTDSISSPVFLSAPFFFITLVLVLCCSSLEGETTKGRVSMASPPATRLVSPSVLFAAFFPHPVLFFHTACFDLRVKELLIRCQACDLRGCRGLKRNCIFNCVRVLVSVCVCACASPLKVLVQHSARSGCWDFACKWATTFGQQTKQQVCCMSETFLCGSDFFQLIC